eukprot:jgi/Chrpa1/4950/Chrysochromulina_OHIO_Genome00017907-RA
MGLMECIAPSCDVSTLTLNGYGLYPVPIEISINHGHDFTSYGLHFNYYQTTQLGLRSPLSPAGGPRNGGTLIHVSLLHGQQPMPAISLAGALVHGVSRQGVRCIFGAALDVPALPSESDDPYHIQCVAPYDAEWPPPPPPPPTSATI